jgi:hypothetical protein
VNGGERECEAFKLLWGLNIPSNSAFCVWRALWGRLPVRANLRRRGVIISINDAVCPFCSVEEESVSHILFNCNFSWRIWNEVLWWLGLSGVFHHETSKHFVQFGIQGCSKSLNASLKVIWAATISCLWEHRNAIVFRSEPFNQDNLVDSIMLKSWNWIRIKGKGFHYSFFEWKNMPIDCLKRHSFSHGV